MVMDILFRPSVLTAIKAEIEQSKLDDGQLDIPKLLAQPLLQSIYSEELRLRASVAVQRVPIVDDFKIGPWKFPKDQIILASAWHEHRDTSVWNEGPVNGALHPVDEFWAERFLVFPNNPNGGPRKPGLKAAAKTNCAEKKEGEGDKPIYTTDSVQGSFIPYGGGLKMCPGRFLAKQEIIVATALFLDTFDIEFESKELPRPDFGFFPFGLLPPVGKFPVKMKRRQK